MIDWIKRLLERDELHIWHEQAVRALRTIAAAKRKTCEQLSALAFGDKAPYRNCATAIRARGGV